MTLTAGLEHDLIQATGRLGIYSLLATGFMLPTENRLDVVASTLLPAVSKLDVGVEVGEAVQRLGAAMPVGAESLRRHFMELFPPIASQDAPGYETGYRGDGIFQQSAIMADIAGFYRAHGLQSGGTERERPDHITVELEYMAFVAKKETLALRNGAPERAAICRDTASAFLRDHLGCWGPAFGLRVRAVSSSPWYSTLGELLALWIEWELVAMGVEPVEVVEHPLPQDPPDDGSCGPCPVPSLGGGA